MQIHALDVLTLFVAGCWLFFAIYWTVSAIGVKKRISSTSSSKTWAIKRLLLAMALRIFYRIPMSRPIWKATSGTLFFHSQNLRISGALFAASGIALAVWARRHLGRNWSGHPSKTVGHELITSGPYSIVRHPIYTGLLVALFGSGLAIGPVAMLLFFVSLVLFMRRIRVEDSYMFELFSAQYSTYRSKTKGLIPQVW